MDHSHKKNNVHTNRKVLQKEFSEWKVYLMEAARGTEKTLHGKIANILLAFKIEPVIFVRDSWFPIFVTA